MGMGGQIARIEPSGSVFHLGIRTLSSRTAFECFINHFWCRIVAEEERTTVPIKSKSVSGLQKGFTRVLYVDHSLKCLCINVHR
jgi:hypothetical protein